MGHHYIYRSLIRDRVVPHIGSSVLDTGLSGHFNLLNWSAHHTDLHRYCRERWRYCTHGLSASFLGTDEGLMLWCPWIGHSHRFDVPLRVSASWLHGFESLG